MRDMLHHTAMKADFIVDFRDEMTLNLGKPMRDEWYANAVCYGVDGAAEAIMLYQLELAVTPTVQVIWDDIDGLYWVVSDRVSWDAYKAECTTREYSTV